MIVTGVSTITVSALEALSARTLLPSPSPGVSREVHEFRDVMVSKFPRELLFLVRAPN